LNKVDYAEYEVLLCLVLMDV